MNKAGLVFVVIAGGYILFELSMLHRLGYRMEADYILQQMVSAQEAMRRCGGATGSPAKAFDEKLERLIQRAEREARQVEPDPGAAAAAAAVESRVAAIRAELAALVAREGCDSPELATWVTRYRIYGG